MKHGTGLIRTFCVAATVSLVSGAAPALAGKADDTLNVAWTRVVETNDFYFHQGVREGMAIGRLVWDNLVDRDPVTNEYKPLLATSYTWVDNLTIDFELRQDVTFHNGAPFSADDVVFTLNWASNPESRVAVPIMVNWIRTAEKTGDYSVRVHLARPFPAALEYLSAAVPIYPKDYYTEVGSRGMSEMPVGTGPYKVESTVPGQIVTLVKNDAYMTDGPKGTPAIGRIVARTITDEQTLVAELLGGRLDWIWNFSADTAENLRSRAGINVVEGETMRIGYISFNAAGVGGPNPMTDVRVRRAVAHALDREAITAALIRGTARVLKSACYPSQFGCAQDLPQYEYDPAKARALLAEAGHDGGLTVDLYGYLDRTHTEAIMGQLAAVGINTNLQWLQFGPMFTALQEGKAPFTHMTTGSWSINDVSITLRGSFAGGPWDIAQDKELIGWVVEGDNVIDPDQRKALYRKALERIQDQVYWLPLNTYYMTYAFKDEVEFTPQPDEVARFYAARWK